LVRKDAERVAVRAVLEVLNEQGVTVPLTRQGEESAKSVVRLMASELVAMAEEVRNLMAS
jgi:hypothetical protein